MGHDASTTFGPYVVQRQLGIGGMASVHLAEQAARDGSVRRVALKRLLSHLNFNKELVSSFVHEGRLMRYLRHPNIPETYAAGKLEGTYYIAMEYAPGPTLKQLVEHCGVTVGTIPTTITMNLGLQLLEGLDHAHTRCDAEGNPLGIIHRDISPANIILSESGLVKLIDFGLAKAKVQSTETAVGVIKGKYAYVAPEYIGGKLDARADLWAVGVVMYELLTSRRLFDAPDAFETMSRVQRLPIPRPSIANPRVPPELDRIVMGALARDPGQRWQTAAAMRDALRGVIAQPGNEVDNRHVIEWVHWVFTQKPGTESTGVSELMAMVRPQTPVPEPPLPHPAGAVAISPHGPFASSARIPVVPTGKDRALALVRSALEQARDQWARVPPNAQRWVLLGMAFTVSALLFWRLLG